MTTAESTYSRTYGTAYRASLAITQTEESDIRIAKDRASATAAIIASAVKAGDSPASWFKSKKVAALPHNVAALNALR